VLLQHSAATVTGQPTAQPSYQFYFSATSGPLRLCCQLTMVEY